MEANHLGKILEVDILLLSWLLHNGCICLPNFYADDLFLNELRSSLIKIEKISWKLLQQFKSQAAKCCKRETLTQISVLESFKTELAT